MNIDSASTALLVVDILVTDASDSLYNPDPQEEVLVANAAKLTSAARNAGLPVLFLCDQHIPGVDRELDLWGEHGVKGKAHPHPALEPGSGTRDFVIPKRRYSGFFQTDLDLTLRELGVKTVIAVGEDTTSASCIPSPTPGTWATTPSWCQTPRAPSSWAPKRARSSTCSAALARRLPPLIKSSPHSAPNLLAARGTHG